MATTKVGVPTIGDAWAYALALWVDFATGTYTSWSYAISTLNSSNSIEVTVGLSGGGTDLYKIGAMETYAGDFTTLTSVMSSPGWRTMPQVLLPATVPGGTAIDTSFTNGPIAMRVDWCVACTNASDTAHDNQQHSTTSGIQVGTWRRNWKKVNLTYTDVIGIMWDGGSVSYDVVTGMPTNLLESAPLVVQGSSSSVDLDPVVAALEDIATMDVEYQANNGGTVWSMRGKVRAP